MFRRFDDVSIAARDRGARPRRAMIALIALIAAAADHGDATAAPPQSLAGWTLLGSMRLEKSVCALGACSMLLEPDRRFRSFALATDAPTPMLLTGKVTTTCTGGGPIVAALGSPNGRGVFQTVIKPCASQNVKTFGVDVASVEVAPRDETTGATLLVFGGVD